MLLRCGRKKIREDLAIIVLKTRVPARYYMAPRRALARETAFKFDSAGWAEQVAMNGVVSIRVRYDQSVPARRNGSAGRSARRQLPRFRSPSARGRTPSAGVPLHRTALRWAPSP